VSLTVKFAADPEKIRPEAITMNVFVGSRLPGEVTASVAVETIDELAIFPTVGVNPFVKKNANIAAHALVLAAVCVGLIGAVLLKS